MYQVVVTAREDVAGEKRLVAYVVTQFSQQINSLSDSLSWLKPTIDKVFSPLKRTSAINPQIDFQASEDFYETPLLRQTVSLNELRDFLSTKLPEYMIPSAFVLLESLPLTPNGKIDRLALPQPESTRQELTQTFILSRNPVEEMLAGIWSHVLGVKEVGIYDNFFELGRHSLLATQIIQRSRQAFKIDLPLRCLFESPTVAKLAQKIETLRQQENYLDFPLQPASCDQQLPLSFAQQKLWFFK